jgi:hypothetical protein
MPDPLDNIPVVDVVKLDVVSVVINLRTAQAIGGWSNIDRQLRAMSCDELETEARKLLKVAVLINDLPTRFEAVGIMLFVEYMQEIIREKAAVAATTTN